MVFAFTPSTWGAEAGDHSGLHSKSQASWSNQVSPGLQCTHIFHSELSAMHRKMHCRDKLWSLFSFHEGVSCCFRR